LSSLQFDIVQIIIVWFYCLQMYFMSLII